MKPKNTYPKPTNIYTAPHSTIHASSLPSMLQVCRPQHNGPTTVTNNCDQDSLKHKPHHSRHRYNWTDTIKYKTFNFSQPNTISFINVFYLTQQKGNTSIMNTNWVSWISCVVKRKLQLLMAESEKNHSVKGVLQGTAAVRASCPFAILAVHA